MKINKKLIWPVIRVILFIIFGLSNTVYLAPEDAGSYKEYLGYFFFIIAIADAISIFRKRTNIEKVDDDEVQKKNRE